MDIWTPTSNGMCLFLIERIKAGMGYQVGNIYIIINLRNIWWLCAYNSDTSNNTHRKRMSVSIQTHLVIKRYINVVLLSIRNQHAKILLDRGCLITEVFARGCCVFQLAPVS